MACVLLGILLCAGCNREERAWNAAESEATIEAYEGFLASYPDTTHAEECREQIETLAWDKAEEAETAKAYEDFVSNFPKSKHVEEALRKVHDLDWETTSSSDDFKKLEAFLEKHPSSSHVAEARSKLQDLKDSQVDYATFHALTNETTGQMVARLGYRDVSIEGDGFGCDAGFSQGIIFSPNNPHPSVFVRRFVLRSPQGGVVDLELEDEFCVDGRIKTRKFGTIVLRTEYSSLGEDVLGGLLSAKQNAISYLMAERQIAGVRWHLENGRLKERRRAPSSQSER